MIKPPRIEMRATGIECFPNRGPVRIVAHGNLLGKGTLVAVGDRLGVRVSEFAPGDL